jgi:thioredoxin-related protein
MQQDGTSRRFEIAACCAIIILCGVSTTVLVKKFVLTSADPPQIRPVPSGTQVSLEYEWPRSTKTLVLVLSTTCRFCDDSAPFYKKLTITFPNRQLVRFVAVFPQEIETGTKHLADLGVFIGDVRQSSLSSLGVSATPTLILVDATGKVIESWVGKLSPADESRVIDRIAIQTKQSSTHTFSSIVTSDTAPAYEEAFGAGLNIPPLRRDYGKAHVGPITD